MQPYPEHHQHHPDLGQLAGEVHVCHEPRRGGADDNSRDEIADQWRKLQASGQKARDQREAKPRRDGGDEADFMRHSRSY
jgi:hypothetical protein